MIVYVKELKNVLLINNIKNFVKNNVELRVYNSEVVLGCSDYILVSQQDINALMEDTRDQIIVYEVAFNKVIESVFKEYQNNWEHYFYKNAINKAKDNATRTIITGSSYGLLGVDESMLDEAVNLSLTSQDLYYSIRTIYEVCESNVNIENIVLCCSYYYLYSDMSRSQNVDSQMRVAKIYNPLFGDVHNAVVVPMTTNFLVDSCIFDVERIMNLYAEGEYRKHYFNAKRPRKNFALRLWTDKGKDWNQLTDEERTIAAMERARLHNKNQKHQITYYENFELLKGLVAYCEERKINLVVLIAPVTNLYADNMWEGYQEVFYKTLNDIDGVVHLLDLYQDDRYTDDDFIDTDHLSDSGAKKMTVDVLNLLWSMRENAGKEDY